MYCICKPSVVSGIVNCAGNFIEGKRPLRQDGFHRPYGFSVSGVRCHRSGMKNNMKHATRLSLSGSLTDLLKPVLLLVGRLVYFFCVHPLASFPGPLLAKGSEVTREKSNNYN